MAMDSRVIETACLGCVFAQGEYRKQNTQFHQSDYGCEMDVLDKLAKQAESLTEVVDKDGNTFYVMKNITCPFYRPKIWLRNMSMTQAKERVRQEVKFEPDVIIYFNDEHTFEDLSKSIDAISNNSLLPRKIYVVNHSTKRPSQVITELKQINSSQSTNYISVIPWRVETIVDEVDKNRALDITTRKCSAVFTVYMDAGFVLPSNFCADIDKVLYEDLNKFIVLYPKHGINGLVVLRLFYDMAAGNAREPIVTKAKKISEGQRCQYLVKPLESIVKNLE